MYFVLISFITNPMQLLSSILLLLLLLSQIVQVSTHYLHMLHTVSFCLKALNHYIPWWILQLILVNGKFINISKKPTISIFKWEKKIGFFKGTAVRIPHITQYQLTPASKKSSNSSILIFSCNVAMHYLCWLTALSSAELSVLHSPSDHPLYLTVK